MEQLLKWDKELFLWLNSLGSPAFDSFWVMITNRGSNVLIYLILTIYLGYKNSWKQTAYLLFFIGLLILFTDQLTNLFKFQVARLRPCYNFEIQTLVRLVIPNCGGKYSFFSGHASNSFALAFFFGRILRSYNDIIPYILILIALIIAYSRVYIGVHYPLDLFCGALVGSFIGWAFHKGWEIINLRI